MMSISQTPTEDSNYEGVEYIDLEEITKISNLFEELKQIRIKISGNKGLDPNNIDNSYKSHMNHVMSKLDQRLKVFIIPYRLFFLSLFIFFYCVYIF